MKKIVRLTGADLTRLVKRVIKEQESEPIDWDSMSDEEFYPKFNEKLEKLKKRNYDDSFFYKWSPNQDYYFDKNDKRSHSDEEFGEPDIEWWHPEDYEKFMDKYPYGEKQKTFTHPRGFNYRGKDRSWFEKTAKEFGGKFPVFKQKRK